VTWRAPGEAFQKSQSRIARDKAPMDVLARLSHDGPRDKMVLLASYENDPPPKFFTDQPTKSWEKKVIVTRSFSNWLASFYRLRHGVLNRRTGKRTSGSILETARYLYDYKIMLSAAISRNDVVHVKFDEFIVSEEVRAGVLESLKIPAVDLALDVTSRSSGSSFRDIHRDVTVEGLQDRAGSLEGDEGFAALMSIASMDQSLNDVLSQAGYQPVSPPAVLA
jgi:hypothetical protein